MTREEAVNYLISSGLSEEQIKTVIEAFTCEDCISRQAVLSYIYNDLGLGDEENGKDVERQMELEDSYRYVKSLLLVKPQRAKGHWIKYSTPRCGEQHYQCTSCGYYINFGQWGELYTKQFKFCPNCGAEMENEDE